MAHNPIGGPATISEEYQPLDRTSSNIRLLELLPGKWTDELSCRMFVVSLDDDPYYEALSYVWGEPDFCRPIWINGSPHSITRNLDRALRRLRQPNRARVMWIDALCINQSNVEERSHQVNMMGAIFSRTAEALLFLADYEEGRLLPDAGLREDSSLKTQSENSPPIENATGLSENSDGVLTPEDAVRAVALLHRLSNGDHCAHSEAEARSDSYTMNLQAIETIVSLPWWSRIWTVQEAALPPQMTVVFGSIHVPWSIFSNAALNIYRHRSQSCCYFTRQSVRAFQLFYSRMFPLIDLRESYYEGPLTLCHYLNVFRYRQASDPRDKVYALIGLHPNDTGTYVDADYSITTSQLYESFVVKSIKFGKDLLPLLRKYELVRRSGLPSWVPDWSAEGNGWSEYEMLHIQTYIFFDASKGTTPVIYPAIDSSLALSGIAVDHVTALGCCLADPTPESSERAVKQWKELLGCENIKGCQYVGGGTYEAAFWRLLTYDVICPIQERPGVKRRRRTVPGDYETFLHSFESQNEQNGFTYDHVSLGRFFITNKGYIGIGSRETKIGDWIYVLHGGKVPFILRPVESQSASRLFQYIGHAYVHGIMDGEVMQNPESQAEVVSLV